MRRLFGAFACFAMLLVSAQASAGIIESGDLNIIDDPGNPSDGLRFLDSVYGDGLSLAAALAYAQAAYSNARLATPSEVGDLVDAAGILYDGGETAEDGWGTGAGVIISSGSNYDTPVINALGGTEAGGAVGSFWTAPDQSNLSTGTRDLITFTSFGFLTLEQNANTPPHAAHGWLIVSDPIAGVPEPSSFLLFGMGGLVLCGVRRGQKRKATLAV